MGQAKDKNGTCFLKGSKRLGNVSLINSPAFRNDLVHVSPQPSLTYSVVCRLLRLNWFKLQTKSLVHHWNIPRCCFNERVKASFSVCRSALRTPQTKPLSHYQSENIHQALKWVFQKCVLLKMIKPQNVKPDRVTFRVSLLPRGRT